MLELASRADQEKVEGAIRYAAENKGEGFRVAFGLLIEGEDYSDPDRFGGGDWYQTDTPISLDAKIAGYLPDRLTDGKVELFSEIEGVLVPQLIGPKTSILPPDQPYVTSLISSSPGAYLTSDDAIKLRSFTEYFGEPPESIAYDILSRVPYDKSQIEVESVPGVYLSYVGFSDSPGFKASEKTGDVLSRLKQSVSYDFWDTQTLGVVAEIPLPLGHATRAEKGERVYEASAIPNWPTHRPSSPPTRYRYVRVFKYDEWGDVAWEVIEEVPYQEAGAMRLARLPYEGQVKDIPLDTTSLVGEEAGRQIARREALDEARGVRAGSELALPVFDALLQKQDRFRVSEAYKDDDGSWQMLWGFRVESYKHSYAAGSGNETGSVGTQVGYTAAVLSEDRIAAPVFIGPGRLFSKPTPTIPPPPSAIVISSAGLGFTELAVNAQGQPWIGINATGGWIDPALGGGKAAHGASGFQLDI